MNIPAHPMGVNGIMLLLRGPNELKKIRTKANAARMRIETD
jgi:hypothetical protein